MFFSKVAILSAISLAVTTLVSAKGNSYGDIYARDVSYDSYGYLSARDADLYARDPYEEDFDLHAREADEGNFDLYARDADPEASGELYARKGPKVYIDLSKSKGGDKNKWGSNKNHETKEDGMDLVVDACIKHKWTGAVITAAFHTSNGETEKHVDFIPDGRTETAHVTKSGVVTIGAGGKGSLSHSSSRESLKGSKKSHRDLDVLEFHRRNFLQARDIYADALEAAW